jgi:hypothetical protein
MGTILCVFMLQFSLHTLFNYFSSNSIRIINNNDALIVFGRYTLCPSPTGPITVPRLKDLAPEHSQVYSDPTQSSYPYIITIEKPDPLKRSFRECISYLLLVHYLYREELFKNHFGNTIRSPLLVCISLCPCTYIYICSAL